MGSLNLRMIIAQMIIRMMRAKKIMTILMMMVAMKTRARKKKGLIGTKWIGEQPRTIEKRISAMVHKVQPMANAAEAAIKAMGIRHNRNGEDTKDEEEV